MLLSAPLAPRTLAPVGTALNVEILEEHVGSEEGDGLVDDVTVSGVVGGRGAADGGSDGEEGAPACCGEGALVNLAVVGGLSFEGETVRFVRVSKVGGRMARVHETHEISRLTISCCEAPRAPWQHGKDPDGVAL